MLFLLDRLVIVRDYDRKTFFVIQLVSSTNRKETYVIFLVHLERIRHPARFIAGNDVPRAGTATSSGRPLSRRHPLAFSRHMHAAANTLRLVESIRRYVMTLHDLSISVT